MPVPLLSIPTVAKQSGTSVLAVRHAVDHGLIDGYRTDSGVRACPPQAVAQMALLKANADGQGGDGIHGNALLKSDNLNGCDTP